MIRQGRLCRSCTPGNCRDRGTATEPIQIECPVCEGHGCEECEDGYVEIEDCPNAFCRDVVDVVTLGELFAKGMPPVAGGVLDQSAWFVEAVNRLEREESLIKAEQDR